MLLSNTNDESLFHTSACLETRENTIKVVGETVKYAYKTDDVWDFKFITNVRDVSTVEIYYLFFNVLEEDGIKWGVEKYIKEVKLNYIKANLTKRNYYVTSTDQTYNNDYFYDLEILKPNGEVYKTHSDSLKYVSLYDTTKVPNFYKQMTDTFTSYVNNSELYHTQTVKPTKIELKYLENSIHNDWVALTAGFYERRKVEYLTLFNTDSEEFKSICETSSDYNSRLLNEYQFGLVLGDQNGYPAETKENQWIDVFLKAYSETTKTSTLVACAGVTEITYLENGNVYKVSVSEHSIDNSKIDIPVNSGDQNDDIWRDDETDSKPKDPDNWFWKLIQNILNFFKYTLPNWWEENKTAIFGVLIVAGVVIVGIFAWKLLSPIITAAAIKKQTEKSTKKEE